MSDNEFYIEPTRRSWPRIAALVFSLAVVVLLTVGAYFYTKVHEASSSVSAPTNFTVASGSTPRSIGQQLMDKNIINSYWSFYLYVKFHGAGDKIQAGNYVLDPKMSIVEIVDALTHGKVISDTRNITVIEGLTNKQLAQSLVDRGFISKTSDLDAALGQQGADFRFFDEAKKFAYQGFLFPDTYTLGRDATAADLVSKMLNNFENKFTNQMADDAAAQHHSVSQVLILASIIEKEVGRNKTVITQDDLTTMQQERRLVASVFYNRLKAGMPLESDATVNYVTGKSDRSVSIADTKIKSPYNTYANVGLPPTPIANPGLDSIMAAIYPAKSDYLYFLSAPDGTAYFAKTLQEQLANKQKYLK